ncbi:glutamate ABC transporter substrate-binding protein [Microbacterium amylolyticum]|uniref:Glutamate transport system substrate-binding protein n=1 Tax=Microbacterium amylolyticum TaxID=936337 RepID=A0ABS4ZFQ5_9MICO|nr:glutamate ABC transporter substrate-binding protein [Microbacterium amylolyticum]MBP2436121.1 glutamate transport system substrate-binding protein [Microbacterium amylolyticum]
MRKFRNIAVAGIAASALFALTACNSGTPGAEPGDMEDGAAGGVSFDVASPELDGSPTFDALTSRGTINIGVKADQPGLGYLDPTTNERSGFDIDIARWMAASLGFADEDINWSEIESANREQAIMNSDVDLYVGTYSMTESRAEQINFAGPYFLTGQGLLVAADNDTITSDADLTSDVVVCSATGSTPIQNIKDNYDAETREFGTYSECIEALRTGQVDAVTTDEAILIGYAAVEPDSFKVVGEPFSEERYGIGLPNNDVVLNEYLNEVLTDGGATWQEIFDHNLGASGVDGVQPTVDAVE